MFHCINHHWTSQYKMCPQCRKEKELGSPFALAMEALRKIEDPRKIGHNEPDLYTKIGCMMNIAHEAINKIEFIQGEINALDKVSKN